LAYLRGANMSFYPGDWYWIPSRAISTPGGNEITEFPAFTFLYGDLHPHVVALPLTLLALGWVLSLVLTRGKWGKPGQRFKWLPALIGLAFGALVIGVLRPTNTWDFYTYTALGGLVLAYVSFRYGEPGGDWLTRLDPLSRRVLFTLARIGVFVGLSLLFFQPYAEWYRQGYSELYVWEGLHTPFWSYLTHWGVFLFVIVSWLAWETRDWMATTPMSSLARLKPYTALIQGGVVLALGACIFLAMLGIWTGWLIVILGLWASVLLFRPGMPDRKRLVLFLFGTGLVITLFVEFMALRGDPGRQNVIFKFYFQVWTLFALVAAAGLGWLVEAAARWRPRIAFSWQIALTLLVTSAALFPLMGGLDKIRDRMAPTAPHSLDGMAYMQVAEYTDDWGAMQLSQDYAAIRWLQENVIGSPVIVEANLRNLYRWGSRMTVYTGLPGVVGWEWHEQQQRAVLTDPWVSNRVFEVGSFYQTTDVEAAKAFLQKYNVEYIIFGQQERGLYPGAGMDKFEQYDGVYWREVYNQGDTVIYQVDCNCAPAS
ncbi:MAG TPA: DUF2298 domain-containing protein, partial [Anaerolineaceae bacterium]|nr:DUF2298 domain-containing protein [Anaerolineaceae bacterium]